MSGSSLTPPTGRAGAQIPRMVLSDRNRSPVRRSPSLRSLPLPDVQKTVAIRVAVVAAAANVMRNLILLICPTPSNDPTPKSVNFKSTVQDLDFYRLEKC